MPFPSKATPSISKYFGLPRNKYKVIYADCPWKFLTYNKERSVPGRAKSGDPYPTMTRQELLDMPVSDIAAKDCVLFMWIIDSHVDQGFELMKHWGFKFKTRAFTWIKTTKDGRPLMGMGHWTRKGSEICIMGTRGKPKRLNAGIREVQFAVRRENSRKPDLFYPLVEKLVGGPYLELFSRTTWNKKWTVWGKDAGKFDAPVDKSKKTRIPGQFGGSTKRAA